MFNLTQAPSIWFSLTFIFSLFIIFISLDFWFSFLSKKIHFSNLCLFWYIRKLVNKSYSLQISKDILWSRYDNYLKSTIRFKLKWENQYIIINWIILHSFDLSTNKWEISLLTVYILNSIPSLQLQMNDDKLLSVNFWILYDSINSNTIEQSKKFIDNLFIRQ